MAAPSRMHAQSKWALKLGIERLTRGLANPIAVSRGSLTCTQAAGIHYGPYKKKWFSRTYVPRFNWAKVEPSEINENLIEENEQYAATAALERYKLNSPLIQEPWPRENWSLGRRQTIRTGLIGIKIGVVPQWTVTGKKILCTMLQVLDNHVIDYRPPEEFSKMPHYSFRPHWKDKGYGSCIVGAISASPLEFGDEYNALFEKSGVPPKRKLTRFVVTKDAAIPPGTPLSAQHFRVGDFVDINSRTIEMGFQGVLVRWGMKGGNASHGTTKSHRRMGSVGGGGAKSGIWKGKHMPGHMGSAWVYLRGMKIVRINTKYNVIYVQGPNVPGPPRSYVRILDTMIPTKRRLLRENPPPMPTFYPEDAVEDTPENIYHEDMFDFGNDTIDYSGADIENLHLHTKQYLLTGGTFDGKNRSRRKGNRRL